MVSIVREITSIYCDWFRDASVTRKSGEWTIVDIPLLDRHNDYLQIYVRDTQSGYLLTDDGETLIDLEMSGCPVNTEKRQELLAYTLRRFGIEQDIETKELFIETSAEGFALGMHNLMQSMLAVGDLFYTTEQQVDNLFDQHVKSWLDEIRVVFTQDDKIQGKSGLEYKQDFVISESNGRPKRVVQILKTPTLSGVRNTMLFHLDTVHFGNQVYAMLNDGVARIPERWLSPMRSTGIIPVKWSERLAMKHELNGH